MIGSNGRWTRRDALKIGTGLFGLTLPDYLGLVHAGAVDPTRRDISCIFLFLAGGISHFESFDPKPEAPQGIRGLWNPQSTNVPGTFITEKLPLLAAMMDTGGGEEPAPIDSPDAPILRDGTGGKELLVPITVRGKAIIRAKYEWDLN